jgi:hypothetical protein
MNFQYHRKTLIASEIDHPYVITALTMLDTVEQAMKDLVEGKIDIPKYINAITPYDKFLLEKFYEKPQKSNPINTFQNKKYSTWREQKWAPIFELIRQDMEKKWKGTTLVVIQNKPVMETVYTNGYIARKDVDGGLGIEIKLNGKNEIIPVIAVEDKGGHCCSYQTNSVNAMALRLHQSFPNQKSMLITDNNVSVGKKTGVEIADNINILVLERGQNRVHEAYPKLDAKRFEEVRKGIINKLSKMSPSDFTNYITIQSNLKGTLRDQIDTTGLFWNW